ncbi:MAG: hypothetical protein M1830_009868 [Pleopsidium flavum]|nr:MAG: hypothetical protein M1830_010062 [Pleopsidium flavum]KAI9878999.1 MAG: hypothetical protein M1830_009868 [Pleopsidium flavum]
MDDDFDSLPPVVRRKFFSTLERLRLAQSPISKTSPAGFVQHKSGFIKAHPRLPRPTLEHKSNYFDSSSPRRLKKSQSRKGSYPFSQADAQWFLHLPDKVRKKHFSREEQVQLAGRRQTVILDVADKALYKLGQENNGSLGTATTLLASTSTVERSVFDSEATVASTSDMDGTVDNCFRWMDDEDDLDLKLDDYHTHLTETTVEASTMAARKPTCRRRLSINTTSFGRTSTSNKMPTSQVSSPLPSPLLQSFQHRTKSRPQSATVQVRHIRRRSTPVIDPAAKHYRDPEARLKLRVYLASPQKFDEAIEFGFPSLENKETGSPPRVKSAGHGHSNDYHATNTHTFLNDGGGSPWEHDRGDVDEASLPDTDVPETPSDAVFKPTHRLPSSWKPNSAHSSYPVRPQTRSKASDTYAQMPTGCREMTLRMTLTRPDLRDDETALYDWHDGLERGDPLALEELPFGPDGAPGVVGPFSGPDGWGSIKDDGVVKRMWRKVSRRS